MELIGMLDSPYVRRVAVSLKLLGLPFTHRPLSVFRQYAEFQAINSVVKVPTLVCDDGTVLIDSTLILVYAEALAQPRSLWPRDKASLPRDLRITGLALVACEKAVQLLYERKLRPEDKQHAPWLARVTEQLLAAHGALEVAIAERPLPASAESLRQADVDTAVAWKFAQQTCPDVVPAGSWPRLAAFSAAAEALTAFRAAPHGDGTYSART